jgi:hypothetical protein
MADVDALFRRLAARGTFRIEPATRWEKLGTEERDGKVWEVSEPRQCAGLAFWPRGQGPDRQGRYGNPFCQRGFTGTSIGEVLAMAEELTRPPWHSLETLVSHYLYEQAHPRQEAKHA